MADETDRPKDRPEDRPQGTVMKGLLADPAMRDHLRLIEALVFASAGPVEETAIAERLPEGVDPAPLLETLSRDYANRGVNLRKVGTAWAFRTAPDLAFLMRKEVEEERKLSRAAIETLAIIAYHPPVTRTEIEEVRGVGIARGTLDQLVEIGWVKLGRRRQTPGRPVTFVTTQGFLDHFGLEALKDLPGAKELREAGFLSAEPPPGFTPPEEMGLDGEADDDGLSDAEREAEAAMRLDDRDGF